jgi:hypothetical protein
MAIRRASVKGFEEADPRHQALYEALVEVRTRGISNPSKPLQDVEALLTVARVVSTEHDDEDKIIEALGNAVGRLGGTSAKAIEALLGLDEATRGHDVSSRREKAAEEYDYISAETFRTRYEPQLLMAVATHLFILLAEHRLAEPTASASAHQSDDQQADAGSHPQPPTAQTARSPISLYRKQIPHRIMLDAALHEPIWPAVKPYATLYDIDFKRFPSEPMNPSGPTKVGTAIIYFKVERTLMMMTVFPFLTDEKVSPSRLKRLLRIPYRAYLLNVSAENPHGERYKQPFFPKRWYRRFMRKFVYRPLDD